jgi:hypothetical protein
LSRFLADEYCELTGTILVHRVPRGDGQRYLVPQFCEQFGIGVAETGSACLDLASG